MSRYGYTKVATGTFDVAIGNPNKNADAMISLMEQATKEKIELLVFPELSITGYTCGDLFLHQKLSDAAMRALERIKEASKSSETLVVVGMPLRVDARLFNCAVYVGKGKILAAVPKMYLPNYNEFYEKRWFSQASNAISKYVTICNDEVPFGTNIIVAQLRVPEYT